MRIRLRTTNDSGAIVESSRVIPAREITLGLDADGSGVLKFTASRAGFTPTIFPFLVKVERKVGTRYEGIPEKDLYIVENDSDNSKDSAKIVSYTATEFVPWLLAGAYVGTGDFTVDGERIINGDGSHRINAGHLMQYFIQESKGRGWLSPLTIGFSPTKDSNGADWQAGDREKLGWRLETFYDRVLERLTDQGLCEWSSKGSQLKLYRHNTKGLDVSDEVTLGGKGFTSVPVKTDVSGWFTHVLGLSEAGRVHASNAAAETRFGRRSAVVQQTGVKDLTAAARLANESLTQGLTVNREESYEWTPRDGMVEPFTDFTLGDLVTARSRGGKLKRRVIAIIINQKQGEPALVQVKVGEKISTLAKRNKDKLNAVTGGAISGGTGGSFPTAPPLPLGTPAAPLALTVAANSGWWGSQASSRATVELTWAPVTASTDGEGLTISHYEVWSRQVSAVESTRDTITESPEAALDTWATGAARAVKVRAISARGVAGEWSIELTVTPAEPSPVVPKKPTGLTIVSTSSSFGKAGAATNIVLGFTAVTQTVSNAPATVDMYELTLDGVGQQRAQASPFGVRLLIGESRVARIRAHTIEGGWSDPSDPITLTAGTPTLAALVPTTPTIATAFGSVTVRWDGTYTAAAGEAAAGVEVERRVGAAWVRVGTMLSAAGTVSFMSAKGSTERVRLVALDRLSRISGTSAETTILVEGVNVGQLEGKVEAHQILFNEAMGDAIFADEAYFGRVTVNHLQSQVGAELNINGNSAINLTAGRQDALESQYASLSEDAARIQQQANAAAVAAGQAEAAAQTASAAALVAESRADTIGKNLRDHRIVFQVNPDNVQVKSEVGNYAFRITATGAAIMQGNTEVSTWDALQFINEEIVTTTINNRAHLIEYESARSTIIKPV